MKPVSPVAYKTAFYHFETNELPFSGFGLGAGSSSIRVPSSSEYFDIPDTGSKQYLLSIEMHAKAEDEIIDPLPLAQFSPTAYVHSRDSNSTEWSARHGHAINLEYRKVTNQSDANVQYDATSQRGFFGSSHGTSGQTYVPILEIPQAPLFSIGQLQNADTSIYAVDPLLAVGNSFGSPLLAPNLLSGSVVRWDKRSRVDTPYLLNRALWDECFFSTIAPQDADLFTAKRNIEQVFDSILANSEHALNPNLEIFNLGEHNAKSNLLQGSQILVDAPERSASFLLQNGQFNINSSSVEAWKALLSSGYNNQLTYIDAGDGKLKLGTETSAPISRFSVPFTSTPGGGAGGNNWQGYRVLTDAETHTLATEIVSEIRRHGPFLSLSEFVNRKVSASSQRGLIDRAISSANLNSRFVPPLAITDINKVVEASARQNVAGQRPGQGAAKFLLQGDVLSFIGHRLASRSDTFRIRTYGDVVDPMTNAVDCKAWIEAIVQRIPEYTDAQIDAPWDQPTGKNIQMGRRFIIKSLKFLSHEDI